MQKESIKLGCNMIVSCLSIGPSELPGLWNDVYQIPLSGEIFEIFSKGVFYYVPSFVIKRINCGTEVSHHDPLLMPIIVF